MQKRRTKPKRKPLVLRIEDRPYVALEGKAAWGVCYKKKHLIEILASLYFPDAKEGYVEKIATIIADVLWDRNYRRLSE